MTEGRALDYDLQYYQSILEPNVEMSFSIGDQQRVFLAYRALFEGQNAHVRQPKAIKRLLKENKKSSSALQKQLGYDKLVAILKTLLESEIFASDLKAKLAFPILYEISPEQHARHEASEAGAAREEAEALKEVESKTKAAKKVVEDPVTSIDDGRSWGKAQSVHFGVPDAVPVDDEPTAEIKNNEAAADKTNDGLPSLYPAQFPFRVQHAILSRVQMLLEECCFDFTSKHAPELVRQYVWDCPEAIELNRWNEILTTRLKNGKPLPVGALKKVGPGRTKALNAVNKLRHSAVHRLRVNAKGIAQMIDSAITFAETLQDSVKVSQLTELRGELEYKIKSQELNKNYLETRLNNELNEIEQERKELARREKEAIAAMKTEDEENMHFVGSLIEARLRVLLDGDYSDKEVQETEGDNVFRQAASDEADETVEPKSPSKIKEDTGSPVVPVAQEIAFSEKEYESPVQNDKVQEEVVDEPLERVQSVLVEDEGNGQNGKEADLDAFNPVEIAQDLEVPPEVSHIDEVEGHWWFSGGTKPEATVEPVADGITEVQAKPITPFESIAEDLSAADDAPRDEAAPQSILAGAIQSILRREDYDIPKLTSKPKKKYTRKMASVQEGVLELLRRELESDKMLSCIKDEAERVRSEKQNREDSGVWMVSQVPA